MGNFKYPIFFETELEEVSGGISLKSALDVKEILVYKKSEYQAICIFQETNFGRVLVLDGIFQTSERDEFIYHESLVHIPLLNHSNPVKVLIIGGGDGGAAEEVLKHSIVEECTLVEIDKEVVEVSKTYLWKIHKGVFDNPRLNLFIEDGANFIKKNKSKFDVIIADLTDPCGNNNPVYTEEFYHNLKKQLKPHGLISLHMGAITAYPAETVRIYKMILKVFKSAIPYFNYIPLYGSIMAFCLCGENKNILTPSKISKCLEVRKLLNLQFLTPETYQSLFAIPPYIQNMLHGKW